MTTLYEVIKAVQAAPKKGGYKQAILEQHKDNELLQAYLKAVYDPRINYYTTKLPAPSEQTYAPGMYWVGEEFLAELQNIICNRQLTGKKAKDWFAWVLSYMYPEDQELLGYIIKRDIVAGIAESTILDVWPNLFFIPPYQRCAKMDEKDKKRFAGLPYFYVETKSDGQFSYLIKYLNGTSENMSRAGSTYPTWLSDKLSVGIPAGSVFAGEMVVYLNGVMLDRETGNGILNSILSGDGDKFDHNTMEVRYIAWDMLTEYEFKFGSSPRHLEERQATMRNAINFAKSYGSPVEVAKSWKVKSIAEAVVIQNEHLSRKEEGTVWKMPNLLWRDCSSGDPGMIKAKLVFEADFKITGMYEGEGKYKGMCGGFNVETSDGLIKFNVGSGFSDAQRIEFWANDPTGKIAAVEGNDILTAEGKDTESVFLPILLEVREDKKVANTREEVWQEFNAARGL